MGLVNFIECFYWVYIYVILFYDGKFRILSGWNKWLLKFFLIIRFLDILN